MADFRAYTLFEPTGSMPLMQNVYALATASDLAYSRRDSWLNSFAQWGGFAEWGVRTFEQAWLPNFVWWRDRRGVVIAFAGTETAEQIVDYVLYDGVSGAGDLGNFKLVASFQAMYRGIRSAIVELFNELPAGVPICFTGHSLGGDMAQIAAADFALNVHANVVRCVTFAAPKVGDSNFVEAAKNVPIELWRNDGDLIALLPFNLCAPGDPTGLSGLIFFATNNQETRPHWVLNLNGEAILRSSALSERLGFVQFGFWLPQLLQAIGRWRAGNGAIPPTLVTHQIEVYKRRILRRMQNTAGSYAVADLIDLNQDVAADPIWGVIQARITREVPPAVNLVFASPSYAAPGSAADIPLDPLTPVTLATIFMQTEVLCGSNDSAGIRSDIHRSPPPNPLPPFDPLRFDQGPRRDWLHKAKDRRMLQALWKVLLAIQARDGKLADAQAEGKQLGAAAIIDPADPELLQAFATILDAAELQLSLFYD